MIDRQWQAAEYVVARLQEHGFEGYLVGGAVRDILLGLTPKDFDVVTNATPEQVAGVAGFLKSSFKDSAQAYGVSRVIVSVEGEEVQIEVATYRRDVEAHLGRKLTKVEFAHIEDDLERRDFTINALALDPYNDFLVDLHGGLDDLEHRIVRFIGEPKARIKEDPLRILRAVRFRSQLGFAYDSVTLEVLKGDETKTHLSQIAVDRVRQELTAMLRHRRRRDAVEDLDSLGMLEHFIPELEDCKGVIQPPDHHSEGDVWVHTLLTIHALPDQPSVRLVWAALLHDIGKVLTFRAPDSPGDRIHFDDHFRVGAELADAVLRRLHFPNKLREEIVWLIHHHLITDSFATMKISRRNYYMSHPAFDDLLDLHAADMRGSIAAHPEDKQISEELSRLAKLWDEYKRQSVQRAPTIKQMLGIDGNWLIQEYGVAPGAKVGELLTQLQEAFADEEIKTIEDAREIIEKFQVKV